ncbi:MAG: hypothetical protein Tp1100SUR639781_42 [Prokaryotic dsDNA virus sp.]|mgnify:CR=1 FL=1|nr:MAG: hypothetical protein Tp1100SUR639781_42 [Prokaryotic dsDNA virus sp.]|tara:strand:+ start:6180 stop:6635 length:456 start_codon:yes stop_codon:yes gene_type:complete
MGYRSEVCIAVQMDDNDKESVRNWHLFIAELKSDPKCDMAMRELMNGKKHEELGENGIDMKNCSLYVHFQDVKWYDTDEWVQSYNCIIGKASHYCEDDKFGMSACFLRVGEETSDLVEECYGDMGYNLACISKPYIEVFELTFDPDNKLIT